MGSPEAHKRSRAVFIKLYLATSKGVVSREANAVRSEPTEWLFWSPESI